MGQLLGGGRDADEMWSGLLTACWVVALATTGAIERVESDLPEQITMPRGTGGLAAERDLAVGRAAVALANQQAVFVVTVDGVVHRLRLPGHDPRLYDDARPGIALSPEGDRLAYAWHGPTPPPTMPGGNYVVHRIPSIVRVVDLRTGAVSAAEEVAPSAGRLRGFIRWDPRWSPDGRYVVARWAQVIGKFTPGWTGCCAFGDEVLDTSTWLSIGGPLGATMFLDDAPELVRQGILQGFSTWSEGRVSADGRWLMLQPRSPGRPLRLLDRRTAPASVTVTAAVDSTKHVRLQGWLGQRHLLALLRGAGTAEMVVLGLPDEDLEDLADPVEASVDVIGRIEGLGPDDVASLASGLLRGPPASTERAVPWVRLGSFGVVGLTLAVLLAVGARVRRTRRPSTSAEWVRRT